MFKKQELPAVRANETIISDIVAILRKDGREDIARLYVSGDQMGNSFLIRTTAARLSSSEIDARSALDEVQFCISSYKENFKDLRKAGEMTASVRSSLAEFVMKAITLGCALEVELKDLTDELSSSISSSASISMG